MCVHAGNRRRVRGGADGSGGVRMIPRDGKAGKEVKDVVS